MPSPRASAAALVALVAALSFAPAASADVPGPRELCDVDGLGCESCWEHYGADEKFKAGYEECKSKLVAKGLSEGCRHRQGAGDQVFFCPAGKKPELKTRYFGGGGGCAGCATSSEASGMGLAALMVGIGLAAVRRRERR